MTDIEGEPRLGIARALWRADPDTQVSEISSVLEDVDQWVCADCGAEKYVKPKKCLSCGSEQFERQETGENDGC